MDNSVFCAEFQHFTGVLILHFMLSYVTGIYSVH